MIAIGVVYNNARIALPERAWELASLRVLGFTRGEVSTFLLGELALRGRARASAGVCARLRAGVGDRGDDGQRHDRDPARSSRRAPTRTPRWRSCSPALASALRRAPADRPARPGRRAEDEGMAMNRVWLRRGGWLLAALGRGGRAGVGVPAAAGRGRRGHGHPRRRSARPSTRTARRACATATSCRRRSPAGCCASTSRSATPVTRGALLATLIPSAPALLDARTERELRERLGAARGRRGCERSADVERATRRARAGEARRKRARRRSRTQGFTSQPGAGAQPARGRAQAQGARRRRSSTLERRNIRSRWRRAPRSLPAGQRRQAAGRGLGDSLAGGRPRAARRYRKARPSWWPGRRVLEIGDPRELEVVVDVLTADAAAIRPGAAVELDHGRRRARRLPVASASSSRRRSPRYRRWASRSSASTW